MVHTHTHHQTFRIRSVPRGLSPVMNSYFYLPPCASLLTIFQWRAKTRLRSMLVCKSVRVVSEQNEVQFKITNCISWCYHAKSYRQTTARMQLNCSIQHFNSTTHGQNSMNFLERTYLVAPGALRHVGHVKWWLPHWGNSGFSGLHTLHHARTSC